MSDSLQPHGLQHARLPCPSLSLGVHPNPCPLSQWCHPKISFFVIPLSSRLQSFPESGSFPMSQFFASGGQSTGASASASVLPMNIQGWFPLGLIDWFDLLAVQGILNSLLQHHHSKASVLRRSTFFMVHPSSTRVCSKSCPLSWWCHLRTKIIIDTVEFFKIYF